MPKAKMDNHQIQARLELGARLHSFRQQICGWSAHGSQVAYEPLVELLRIDRHSWARWEGGKTMPPEIVLALICEFNVSPRWLRNGDGPMFMTDGSAHLV
jgi:hypothetical protein